MAKVYVGLKPGTDISERELEDEVTGAYFA
jgi:hypothetical protein